MSKPASKRQQEKVNRQKRERRDRIITISVISFVALLFAVALILPNLNRGANVGTINVPQGLTRAAPENNSAGFPDAPVKVIEYSDFRCSHCRDFFQTQEGGLVTNYINTGKVYFTYSPFSFLSPESFTAAEAAYCAQDQGKFWEYHDILFANYDLPYSDERLQAFAKQLGLNERDFSQCYKDGKYKQQVLNDADAAKAAGVTGTPTFSVNGQLVDRSKLTETIDAALGAN